MSSDLNPTPKSGYGEPCLEATVFLPQQGKWHEEDFLRFHTNRMAELNNGFLEILPMPTWLHALIVELFVDRLRGHLSSNGIAGKVLPAVIPVRLFEGTIREPDVLFCKPENIPQPPDDSPRLIDLTLEVVSKGEEARKRDYEDKVADYAKAGVSEYWIIDPQKNQITVLFLNDGQYETVGVFEPGAIAESRFLPGFTIKASEVFALGDSNANKGL